VITVLVPEPGSREFTRVQQEGVDMMSVSCHVELQESCGAALSEAIGLLERELEGAVERTGRL
jgi:hypothetical protein